MKTGRRFLLIKCSAISMKFSKAHRFQITEAPGQIAILLLLTLLLRFENLTFEGLRTSERFTKC